MWTPCDDFVEEYNAETGKMEKHHYCPYAATYAGKWKDIKVQFVLER